MMRRPTIVVVVTLALLSTGAVIGQSSEARIDTFFTDFTAQWVRANPNLATSTRYFTGDEQDRLDRQLTPQTEAYKRSRIRLARQGHAQLAQFDRAKLTDVQRASADLMQWQLQTVVDEEQYLDYTFPLEQMSGVNVGLVETLTVRYPILSERGAKNYIAALGQVGTRMEEAIAESRRLAAGNTIPPRFILQATVKQMQGFVEASPAQNPFVTIFAQKMAAVKSISYARREELRAQAENIVATQVYQAWKKGYSLLESQLPRSTDDAGLWRLKGGDAAYAYFLHRFTTTNLTADQIQPGRRSARP